MDVSFSLFSPAPHQISITNVNHLTRANMTFLHSLRYLHFVCPHPLSLTLLPCLGVWNGHTNSFFSLCLPVGIWLTGSSSRKSGGRRIMLGYFFFPHCSLVGLIFIPQLKIKESCRGNLRMTFSFQVPVTTFFPLPRDLGLCQLSWSLPLWSGGAIIITYQMSSWSVTLMIIY